MKLIKEKFSEIAVAQTPIFIDIYDIKEWKLDEKVVKWIIKTKIFFAADFYRLGVAWNKAMCHQLLSTCRLFFSGNRFSWFSETIYSFHLIL